MVVWGYEGGEEGEVYAEGVRGHLSTSLNFETEGVGARLRQGCELLI